MWLKITLVLIVLCAVIGTTLSDRGYCRNCKFIPYRRIKRGKYFPGPPQRFYSRPPVSFPHIGAFSYTPPPNYMSDEDPPYPGPGPYKVSKRPTKEGLGDEDINNIMKYLTKQDLDKLLEFANDKQKDDRDRDNLRDFSNGYNRVQKKREEINVYKVEDEDDDNSYDSFRKDKPETEDNRNLYKANVQEIDSEQKQIFKTPFKSNKPYEYTQKVNYVTEPTPRFVININDNEDYNKASENLGRILNKPNVNAYTEPNINQITTNYGVNNILSDIKVADEEYLPKPVNLRGDDVYGSYTNNVANVVKADASYEVKNFGELPLMGYTSKLDTVSSYHVPHYTVTTTTTKQNGPSAPQTAPIIEKAPPVSVAQEQSDAHLKAIKIWSHKSKGTAYTLHNDGTLSLEKPITPHGYYSYT